jgi:hypothetical protein
VISIGEVSTDATADSGITLPHVCESGESLLFVSLCFLANISQEVKAVTYAGLPLTFFSKSQIASDVAEEIWVLYSPPAGTAEVKATFNRFTDIICAAVSISGSPDADAFYASQSGAGQDSDSVDFFVDAKKDTAILESMTLANSAQPQANPDQRILWDVLYNGLRGCGLLMNPTADAIIEIANSLDKPSNWTAHVFGIKAS